jgi:hypothetical protein
VPTFPVSPEARAKMMVRGLQAPEERPSWVSPVSSLPPDGIRLDMEVGMDSDGGEERVGREHGGTGRGIRGRVLECVERGG